MSKRHHRRRRERKAWERGILLDTTNKMLTYDELHSSLQRVVMMAAMAYKAHGVEEETAINIATNQFIWGAHIGKVWQSMYTLSRLAKVKTK